RPRPRLPPHIRTAALIQTEPGQFRQLRVPIQQLGRGDPPDLLQIDRPHRPHQRRHSLVDLVDVDLVDVAEAEAAIPAVAMPRLTAHAIWRLSGSGSRTATHTAGYGQWRDRPGPEGSCPSRPPRFRFTSPPT